MKITPRRRTTLQFSQMRLTLERTFMARANLVTDSVNEQIYTL
jgi:hypothetical protein